MSKFDNGNTNAHPLGKTRVSFADFAAGVSTTQASRHRAGGPSHANPHPRSRHIGIDVGDGYNAFGYNGGSRKS